MMLPKPQKFLILLTSLLIATAVYMGAYAYFSPTLTDWQKEQNMDLMAGTGTTKMQVYARSFSCAGLSFAFSAIILFAVLKNAQKKAGRQDVSK